MTNDGIWNLSIGRQVCVFESLYCACLLVQQRQNGVGCRSTPCRNKAEAEVALVRYLVALGHHQERCDLLRVVA